jgi:CRP-like cAMP-binding protein
MIHEVYLLNTEILHYSMMPALSYHWSMLSSDELLLEIFEDFSLQEIEELKLVIHIQAHNPGEIILFQNQPARNLFIVAEGEVEITHLPYDGPELSVGRLSSGGIFGWSAILGRKTYTSTVKALTSCRLYCIPSIQLQKFCELHHETGVVLLEKIALSVAQNPDGIHEQIMQMIRYTMACGDGND